MFRALKRILKYTAHNFLRNSGSTIATIFVMFMAISVLTSLFLAREVSQFVILGIQEKVDVAIYFKKDVSEDEILNIKKEVSQLPEAKKVDYVSKEQALNRFIEKYKDDPVMMQSLQEVDDNPFLASLGVAAYQANQYQQVVAFVENADFKDSIEKVDYFQRKSVIDKIFSAAEGINIIGIILSAIMALVAGIVAYNTIRLAIYNSREEIKIQRLVGAGNWFIRGPFLLEGVIAGIIAALVCFGIFLAASWLLAQKVENFYPSLNLLKFFMNNLWQITLIQFGTGIVLGLLSSWLAIRKYMRA